eukprot:1149034-Pleurochrysis_carterae.AAC.1
MSRFARRANRFSRERASARAQAAAATAEAAPKADAEVLLPPVGEGSLASSDANWDMKNCSSRPRRHKQANT